MPIKLYTVIWSGETLSGRSPAEVGEALKSLLALSPADAGKVDSGKPLVLLKDGDKDEAMSLKNALFKIGALAAVQSAVPREPKVQESNMTMLDMCLPGSSVDPCGQARISEPEPRAADPAAEAPPPARAGDDAPGPSIEDELADPDYAAAILELAANAPGRFAGAVKNGFGRWVKAAFGRLEKEAEGSEEPDRMIQSIATGSFIMVCVALPLAMYGYISQSGLLFGMPLWKTLLCMAAVVLVVLASKRFGLAGLGVSSVFGLTAILFLSGGRLSLGWLFSVLAGLFLFLGIAGIFGAAFGAALGFLAWEWSEKKNAKTEGDDPLV